MELKGLNIFYRIIAFLLFLPTYIFIKTIEIPKAYGKYLRRVEIDLRLGQAMKALRLMCDTEAEFKFVVNYMISQLESGKKLSEVVILAKDLIKSRQEFRNSKAVK